MNIYELSSEELVIYATLIGIQLAKNRNIGQKNILGSFLFTIGQTILTLAEVDEVDPND